MKNFINKYTISITLLALTTLFITKYYQSSQISQQTTMFSGEITPLNYTNSTLLNKFNKKNIDEYQTAAGTYDIQTIASEVTSTMLTAFSNSSERTLPLVANWNVGIPKYSDGLDPLYLINRFTYGEHLVPTWKLDSYYNDNIGLSYYETSIKKAAALGLPLIFILPSPESALTKDDVYFSMGKTQNPNVITVKGTVLPELSPFGPDSLWKEVGGQWSTTTLMTQLQEWYPNPPLVIFIDEDTSKKLSWSKLATSSRYIEQYPTNTSNEFKRTLINAKWLEKYRQLHEGFKQGFTKKAWKQNVKFVTRNQLAVNMGATSDWINNATTTNQYANIWPLTVDGLTINFNLDGDKTDTTDTPYRLLNNLPFMLEEAKELNPNFTYQLSIDANQKIDNPQRYRGFTQFALWFLRPSIIRQAPNKTTKNEINPLFQQVVDSVELIHNSDVLADFWKNGKLVSTGTSQYKQNIPINYQSVPREFLLKTDASSLVWAFALEKGKTPNREWLIYTQSPKKNLTDTTATIPNFKNIKLKTMQEGNFYLLHELHSDINELHSNIIIGKRNVKHTDLIRATKYASPNGNGKGTIDDPYNLSEAMKSLVPGDVLFLRDGIYDIPNKSGIRITKKIGTKEKPIIIESYPGEKAILDGKCMHIMDAVNEKIDTSYGLYIRESDYIYIRKIEIRNMSKTGIKIVGKHNKIEGCKIHNNFLPGISVENRNGYTIPYIDGWNLIIDNEIYNNSDAGYNAGSTWKDGDNADGISISSSANNTISHNTIYGNSDDGIDVWKSNYSVIEYNLVYDNGRGSKGTGNGIKMGGNSNPKDPFYFLNGIGAKAYHNISFNNKALGFHQNRGKFVVVSYNTAYNNGGTGFSFNDDINLSYNIAFKNKSNAAYPYASTRINNSWNLNVQLTFQSLNPKDKNFLRPNENSFLSHIGAYAEETN